MTNAELAQALRDLRDFLIVAGYEESHAFRYTAIARHIERMPEDVEVMKREHRLQEIPGVGKLIAVYIREILEDGRCSKVDDWVQFAPWTVTELCRIPGVGAKTAAKLWHGLKIGSLDDLRAAFAEGRMDDPPGLSPKILAALRAAAEA